MLDFIAMAALCVPAVHPHTIAAVVRHESRFNPYAIGINRSTVTLKRQPKTAAEAVETAKWLISQGHNIDLGLGQINSKNLQWLGLSVEDAFDGCKNLKAAGTVLVDNFQRALKTEPDPSKALAQALSAYNTGNFTFGFTNGYVAKVKAGADVLAAQGFVVPSITAGQGDHPAAYAVHKTPAPPELVVQPTLVESKVAAVAVQQPAPETPLLVRAAAEPGTMERVAPRANAVAAQQPHRTNQPAALVFGAGSSDGGVNEQTNALVY